MVKVRFTANLERHIETPAAEVAGDTVRAALESVFDSNSMLRGYILDDQGALRQHVMVFVNGEQVRDRSGLADAVPSGAEIFVMQALSGG
jgi:molybdopterin converting factor small subunit